MCLIQSITTFSNIPYNYVCILNIQLPNILNLPSLYNKIVITSYQLLLTKHWSHNVYWQKKSNLQ